MTPLLAAALAALAAAGYLAARWRAARSATAARGQGSPDGKDEAPSEPKESPFEGLPLALGDVVAIEGEERWLAGALVARDRGKVPFVLFLAPEGRGHGAVLVFAPPRRDIHWLDPKPLEAPAEPPATIEIAGVMFQRRGRLPVSVERLGQGAPSVGETALWAIYESGGRDVALVVTSEGNAFAWSGKRFDVGEYDRLGGGD